MSILTSDFYDRPALEVARDLLGCRLVRVHSGLRLAGLIMETEAYQGEEDLGCHAASGRTPRTKIMYGPPGYAYVYFTYGIHWLLNTVSDRVDKPAAVLIRAIRPIEGQSQMAENRPYRAGKPGWTDGPAKLTQALAIDGHFNGLNLCNHENGLWIEPGKAILDDHVQQSSRVGLRSVPEPWQSIPWRFVVNQAVLDG